MIRVALLCVGLAASAACAPAMMAGGYAPRPFPGAPAPGAMTAIEAEPGARAEDGSAAREDARAAVSAAVLTTAMGLAGVPYRLGGSDPSGFDCSGFVQYVLRQHAIGVPRTVIQQFSVGDEPPAVEPGDLVFFRTAGARASHVGIAIDAQSFVHAPNSRGVVRVDRLDARYWSDRFLGARRIF